MNTTRKDTLFSWVWRKIYKKNLPPSLLLLLFFTYYYLKAYTKMVFGSIDSYDSIF